MNILEIIEAKRTNHELTVDQINYAIDAYVKNKIPDYQFSALNMAMNINGLSLEETFNFTKAFLESGNTIDLSDVEGIKIDKHSTGGVGDKVSVIICPILAACGLKIAKMSGKGLGHTGGTIDKLNSIGVNCDLSVSQCKKILQSKGVFIASQTSDIVPADKKVYALRNSTSTVDSIPLIAVSIASKKLAMKTDYVFIDVKIGDGGFCENIQKATKLSKLILYLLKRFGRKCIVHITNMDQPLGRAIGNAIEMKSTIDFLEGNFESEDIRELIYEFSSDILVSTKIAKNKKEAINKIDEVIKSKKALNAFYE
ncbi:MAG: thymidine phosphorylase [Mycoplasmoidaceae bacterium]|nr:thymidine phosphorylase [Mycoplasmoidaceae bacterium]